MYGLPDSTFSNPTYNYLMSQPVDPGTNSGAPSFWSQLQSGVSRASSAGGGLQGLVAALSPSYSASLPMQQTNRSPQASTQQPAFSGNSATMGNAAASQAAQGGLSKLGGALSGAIAGL